MNYENIYQLLIERAKFRILESYSEQHHILPKCIGGSDDSENIVRLTPEEHYLAHLLLVKIYKDNEMSYRKLLHACNLMSGNSNLPRSNKMYGWIKRRISNLRKGVPSPASVKRKISESLKKRYTVQEHHLKGKRTTDEHKKKCSDSLKGRTFSSEHRRKIGNQLKGRPHNHGLKGEQNPQYITVPAEIAYSIINDYQSGVTLLALCDKFKYSEPKINSILTEYNVDKTQRKCPHCGKSGSPSNMIRWHFNNCRLK